MRTSRRIIIGRIIIVAMLIAGLGTFLNVNEAQADSGAWFGTGSGTSSPSGSSTSGNGDCTGNANNHTGTYGWREDCAGSSWVFYRANKDVEAVDVNFPESVRNSWAIKESNATIPKVCAESYDGFWHFGTNYYRGSSDIASRGGTPGHNRTVPWGQYTTTWSRWPGQLYVPLYTVNQTIGNGLYSADRTKSSTATIAAVTEDYRVAYCAAYPDDSNCASESAMKNINMPDNLWAFCWGEDMRKATYYGQSNVGASVAGADSSGSKSTGKVSSMTSAEYEVEAYLDASSNKTDVVAIRFSHNPYTSQKENDVAWSVRQSASLSSGTGYTISKSGDSTSAISPSNMTVADGRYYAADNRINGYVRRDLFNVTFTAAGTYRFCEYLTVKGMELTEVCAVIKVKKSGGGGGTPVTPGTCAQFTSPSSYTSSNTIQNSGLLKGETSVVAHIKNFSLTGRSNSGNYSHSNDYRNWITGGSSDATAGIVYAKPGDTISWINCYYPGVQYLYDDKYATSHKDSGCQNDDLPSAYLRNLATSGWSNNFKVVSKTDASKNGIFSAPSSVIASNKVTPSSAFSDSFGSNKYGTWTLNVTGTNGNSDVRSTVNSYTAKLTNDVGKYYGETISTPGTPQTAELTFATHSWTCCNCTPRPCTCSHPAKAFRSYNYAGSPSVKSSDSDLISTTQVKIPYNFINTTGLGFNISKSTPVYAGETVTVDDAWAKVNVRDNYTTADKYATQVDDGQVTMISYVTTSSQMASNSSVFNNYTGNSISTNSRMVNGTKDSNVCDLISERKYGDNTWCREAEDTGSVILNENGSLTGAPYNVNGVSDGIIKGKTFATTYNVYDAPAGDYFCMAMAIFPASSGAVGDTSENGDKNMKASGDGKWYISEPECRIIAKKPSVQILGSDLFTNGSAKTNTALKQQLYQVGGYEYNAKNRSRVIAFGSWVEEGILSNRFVEGLSSGASLGKVTGDSRTMGAENASRLCDTRAPLSFANYATTAIGTVICPYVDKTGAMDMEPVTINRGALADYWGNGEDLGTSIYLSGDEGNVASATGRNIKVYSHDGNVTVTGGSIPTDTMRIVKASEMVTISGNIEYAGGSVSSPGSIPKVVIYAKNIDIECAVTRIDAILIAEGVLNTCTDPDSGRYWEHGGSAIPLADRSVEVNNPGYAVPLTINGAVIANRLELPRTYGAATGNDSGLAAETINYDTSMLLWGRYMAGSAESDTMTVTYQHELAPRY